MDIYSAVHTPSYSYVTVLPGEPTLLLRKWDGEKKKRNSNAALNLSFVIRQV
jgi:hypothetical protein